MIEAPHTETPPTPASPYAQVRPEPATWPSPSPMVWDFRKLVPLGAVCLVSVVAISYWLTPAAEEVQASSPPVIQQGGVVASVPPGQPSPIVERLVNETPRTASTDPAQLPGAPAASSSDKDAKITLLERKVNAMAREVQALKQRRASNQEEATPRRRHRKVKSDPPKRRYVRTRPATSSWWF